MCYINKNRLLISSKTVGIRCMYVCRPNILLLNLTDLYIYDYQILDSFKYK